MKNTIYLSSNIRHLRTKQSLTLEELGALIRKSKETINGYEKGRSFPAFEGLLVIADYFNVGLDEFVYEDLTKTSNRVEDPAGIYQDDVSRLMMGRIKELEREIKEHAPDLANRLEL